MLAELRPHLTLRSMLEQAGGPVTGFMQTLKRSRISVSDAVPYIAEFFKPLPKGSNPYKTYADRLDECHDDPEMTARITGRQSTELAKDVVLIRTLKTAETVLDHIVTHGGRVPNVDEFFRIIDRLTKKLKSIAPNKQPKKPSSPGDMWSKDT